MARTINSLFPKEFRWSPFLSDDGKNKVREIPLPLFKKKKTDHCLMKDVRLNGSLVWFGMTNPSLSWTDKLAYFEMWPLAWWLGDMQ